MPIGFILLAIIVALLAAPFAGFLLLRYFLANEVPEDAEFDNPAIPPPLTPWPVMVWHRAMQMLGRGPRQITYRRDRHGRFRKRRR